TKTLRIAVRAFEPFESAIKKIWEQFCTKNDSRLELEIVPLNLESLYDELIEQRGLKNGSWDLALINTDWIAELYSSQAVEDLQSYIDVNPPRGFPDGWPES